MDEKIRVLFIFEILGRPPEHIKKTLEEIYNPKTEEAPTEAPVEAQ